MVVFDDKCGKVNWKNKDKYPELHNSCVDETHCFTAFDKAFRDRYHSARKRFVPLQPPQQFPSPYINSVLGFSFSDIFLLLLLLLLFVSLRRTSPQRGKNETWVSIHFRWGDEAHPNPLEPLKQTNSRAAGTLGEYCAFGRKIAKQKPKSKVFLFAENLDEKSFEACDLGEAGQLMSGSKDYYLSLDIMSQSQVRSVIYSLVG